MKLVINGEQEDVPLKEGTIIELLHVKNVEMPEAVSVEHNGRILDRKDFDQVRLGEGDTIEFLYYMGGGSYPVDANEEARLGR